MKTTMTQAGPAIITHPHLTLLETIGEDGYIANVYGSTALGILLDANGKPSCWCLFWEWGGDWSVFLDAERHDGALLEDWEPDAAEVALEVAIETVPDCAEDMDWFSVWADDARAALAEFNGEPAPEEDS